MESIEFRPAFWLRNPHVQTVLGVLWKGSAFPHRTTRRRVRLPDGDCLVLHDSAPRNWTETDPIAVLVHGLGGSHRSGAIVRMARMLYRRGARVVRLDLRGAGCGLPLARGSYNAGCSADVRAALEAVHRNAPAAPIWLAGISLGANVSLKLAGEGSPPGLERVAAMAPPVDLAACVELISHPRNRFYDRHFVHELLVEARRRERCFPDRPLPPLPATLTLRQYDELITAPRGGFRDAADYYARSSSNQFVPRIEVPTLVLSARDDPFVAPEPIERLDCPPHVEVRLTDRGGHVGYLGDDGAGGWCWGERRIVDWLYSGNQTSNRNGLKSVSTS